MATLTGQGSFSPQGGYANGRITVALRSIDPAWIGWPGGQIDVGVVGASTGYALTRTVAAANSRVLNGQRSSSYFDDFYNRIHYTPAAISFGNILALKQTTLAIWNAFLVPKTLSALTVPDGIGIVLIPPAGVVLPQVLTPLREVVYVAQAAAVGAPTINAHVASTVDGVDHEIPITGNRIVVFPYAPNWASAYDETFIYNSWVLPAADGSEQTGSNWGNQPRRSFEYTILVTEQRMQYLENLLFGWQQRLFGVPHWADRSTLTAVAALGGTTVAADTTDRSFEVGGFALIYVDSENFEAFEILSMTASSLASNSPLAASWPAGSKLFPLSACLIAENLSGAYRTDSVLVMPVSFESEPSQSPVNNPVGVPTPLYRGEELYLGKLDWASALAFQQQSDREVLDYQGGRFRSYSHAGFSKTTRKHNWQVRTRAEARGFRAWLGRREGIARPVFMPTGNTDLTLRTAIVSSATAIEVEASGYEAFVDMASARRDIIILLRDGTYFARRITDAQPAVNGVTVLSLDTLIPQNVALSQVKRISFLVLYRQDSNSTTIRWLTDTVGVAEANLKTKTAA